MSEDQRKVRTRMIKIIKKYTMNERFIIRFGSLLILAFIIFPIIWSLSYYFLPEGLMRGKTPTEYIVGPEPSSTFIEEWFKIAGFNLMATLLVIILNLVLWIDLIPLGYMYPFGQIILYAVFIGTNSFFIPMPERMAPSLAILTRAGPYEMIGFLLVAAATYNQSRYALTWESHRIMVVPRLKMEQWIGLGAGFMLIILAGWWEATMIFAL